MDYRIDEIEKSLAFKSEIETHFTERIILREVGPVEHAFLLNHKDEALVRSFLNIQDDEEWLFEKRKLEEGLSSWCFSFTNFYLFKKENGTPLGYCGFHVWNKRHRKAEIGYSIYEKNDWGQGFAQEAVKFVIDFGYNKMNLIRIEAMTTERNEASIKILNNAGFVREGFQEKNYLYKGNPEDSVLYGLINPKFKT